MTAYTRELQTLKTSYLYRQYRNCIHTGEYLLDETYNPICLHPYQKAFIKFYQALSHDELARAMHSLSQTKLAEFDNAVQCYKEALTFLACTTCDKPSVARDNKSHSSSVNLDDLRNVLSNPPTTSESLDGSDRSEVNSSVPATTPHKRASRIPIRTPPPVISRTSLPLHTITASDAPPLGTMLLQPPAELVPAAELSACSTTTTLDHRALAPAWLSSNGSDIQSVGRLDRDYSRISLWDTALSPGHSKMSLLEESRIKPSSLPKTVSQGLLRPIRPGSPAKQYFFPPIIQQYPGSYSAISTFPRSTTQALAPDTHTQVMSKLGKTSSSENATTADVDSYEAHEKFSSAFSVSSFSSELSDINYHETAKSPVEPPNLGVNMISPISHCVENKQINEHLDALRSQCQRHIELAERARLITLTAQADRVSIRMASPRYDEWITSRCPKDRNMKTSKSSSKHSQLGLQASPIPQIRSFWSFTPENQKVMERRRRIEAGRERGWVRARFDNKRYMALAEDALAEL